MKSKIIALIAEDKIELAMNELLFLTKHDADFHQEIIQLSARFRQNERQRRLNLIDTKDINIENNKIREALLSIVYRYFQSNAENINFAKYKWSKLIIVTLTVFSVVILSYFLYKALENKKNPAPVQVEPQIGVNSKVEKTHKEKNEKDVNNEKDLNSNSLTDLKKSNPPPITQKSTTISQIIPDSVQSVVESKSPQEALSINCKTDKGDKNLIYKEGETMRLYVKVNRPCHLRVFYRLADGQIILFENDRQISNSEVERFIEIGDGFEASPPFGDEQLYAFVQNSPFKALQTKEDTGYNFVTEGLPETLMKTKAFKKKEIFAETTLQIVTKNK